MMGPGVVALRSHTQMRKVRGGGVRLRGELFTAPEFAELDGQFVSVFDVGPMAGSVPVFGPTGPFRAVPSTLRTADQAFQFEWRRRAWERARRAFVASVRAEIQEARSAREEGLVDTWGDAASPARRSRQHDPACCCEATGSGTATYYSARSGTSAY